MAKSRARLTSSRPPSTSAAARANQRASWLSAASTANPTPLTMQSTNSEESSSMRLSASRGNDESSSAKPDLEQPLQGRTGVKDG